MPCPTWLPYDAIRGDLHCHTRRTDGREDARTLAEAARDLGYEYLAITDHSQHLAMTHGLDSKGLREQIAALAQLNDELEGIEILKGIEVDILEDGQLDLPDEVLRELDLTVCSIHSHFDLSRAKQTRRLLRAMDNPYCTIIGHPTGRLIQRRDAYALAIEDLIRGAAERGVCLEINAQPRRLDLADRYARAAGEAGARVAISTDAHGLRQLQRMSLGVAQARRGWLSADQVLNTRSLADLRDALQRP